MRRGGFATVKGRTNSWKEHLEAMIGGAWYSIPTLGQCPASAPLGSAGCSWRLLERPLAFNASCVHSRLRAAVEAFGGSGFAARCSLAERRDVGSDCYTEALFDTILGNGTGGPAMPLARLVSVWEAAFAASGCPPEELAPVGSEGSWSAISARTDPQATALSQNELVRWGSGTDSLFAPVTTGDGGNISVQLDSQGIAREFRFTLDN
eukprot:SAG11_NODE_9513_length_905_cov_1.284119_1_plen_207_part_01